MVKTQLLQKDKHGISAVDADQYVKRFLDFCRSIILDEDELKDGMT